MKQNDSELTSYVRVRIHETQEENEFDTHAEAMEWIMKVSHTLQEDVTAEITQVTERTVEWYAEKNGTVGLVR